MLQFFSEVLRKQGPAKQKDGDLLVKLDKLIPENFQKKSSQILDRILMALYWIKCEYSLREEIDAFAKRILAESPDCEKEKLLAKLDDDKRWKFFPANPWAKSRQSSSECLEEWKKPQQFIAFLEGFDEPYSSYFNQKYFLGCFGEIENRGSLSSFFQLLKEIDLPTSLLKKHWAVTWLIINLQNLFDRFGRSEEPMACIYGARQLLLLKILESIFDGAVEAFKTIPEVIQDLDNGEIDEQKLIEIVSHRIGFSKMNTNLGQIFALAQGNLVEILKGYLTSFSNSAAEELAEAANDYANGVEALDQICCLRVLVSILTSFEPNSWGKDQFLTVPESYSIFNYALLDIAHELDYFDFPAYARELSGGVTMIGSELVDLAVQLSSKYHSKILLHCNKRIYASISLRNNINSRLENLALKVSVYGEKGSQDIFYIGNLESGQMWQGELPVNFDENYINNVEEPEPYSVEFRVLSNETVLFCIAYPVNILPWNQFFYEPFPEVLACFVTANSVSIQSALIETRKILAERGLDSSTEGYQSGDKLRVLEIIKAVYDTLSRLEISYSNPPNSIARLGQKIRLPDQVFKQKQGTCLDLSGVMIKSCVWSRKNVVFP